MDKLIAGDCIVSFLFKWGTSISPASEGHKPAHSFSQFVWVLSLCLVFVLFQESTSLFILKKPSSVFFSFGFPCASSFSLHITKHLRKFILIFFLHYIFSLYLSSLYIIYAINFLFLNFFSSFLSWSKRCSITWSRKKSQCCHGVWGEVDEEVRWYSTGTNAVICGCSFGYGRLIQHQWDLVMTDSTAAHNSILNSDKVHAASFSYLHLNHSVWSWM